MVATTIPSAPPKQQLPSLPASDGRLLLDLEAFEDETRCAVCLGVIKEARLVAQCMHRFCSTCIEKWLRLSKENVCPQCRKPMQSRRDCKADLRFDRIVSLLYDDVQEYEAKVFDASEEVMLKAFQQGAALKRLQEERKAATRGRGRGNWRGRGRSSKPRGGRSAKPVPPADDSSSSAPSESDSDSGAADSYGASKGGTATKRTAGSKRTAHSPAAGSRAFKRPTNLYSPDMYLDDPDLEERAPSVGRGRGRGRRSRGGRGSRGARSARSDDGGASPVAATRGSRGRGHSRGRGRGVGSRGGAAAPSPLVEYVNIRSDAEVQQQAEELAAEAAAAACQEPEPIVSLHVRCDADDGTQSQLPRPYFSCPASLTIGQLQRVIEEQLIASGAGGGEVQVVCCCDMDGGISEHRLDRHCAKGMQDVLESEVMMSELVHDMPDCRQSLLTLMFRIANL